MPRTLKAKDPKHAKQQKAKILIYGEAGVGKTWFSLDFPDVYYVDVEGGASRDHYREKLAKSGAAYFGPEDGSQDFEAVIEEVITLASVEHHYRTLVIDSFTKLFQQAQGEEEERLLNAGKKVEFGIDKKAAIRLSRKLVRWLGKIDMNVVLICHEKANWSNGEQIGVTFDGWDKMAYELDMVFHAMRRGRDSRVLMVKKSRLKEFPEAATMELSYAEFADRYGEDAIQSDVSKITLADSEQLAKLNYLIKERGIDDETQAKWLKKANVEEFREMEAEKVAKLIEHLEQKAEV